MTLWLGLLLTFQVLCHLKKYELSFCFMNNSCNGSRILILVLLIKRLLLKVFIQIHIMFQVYNLLKRIMEKDVLLILKAEVEVFLVVVSRNMPLHPTLFRALISLDNHRQVLVVLPLLYIIHHLLVHFYRPWEF